VNHTPNFKVKVIYRQIGYVERGCTLTIGPIGKDYIDIQISENKAKKVSRLQ
jgi:hypothetical protein